MAGDEQLLEPLVGEPISGVAFVTDNVEIHLNGLILRSVAHPRVEYRGRIFQFPDAGSRDALCTLIGDVVAQITVRGAEAIVLVTVGGIKLIIPLDEASAHGGECAHLVMGPNQPVHVW